jgi:hypothetical protein
MDFSEVEKEQLFKDRDIYQMKKWFWIFHSLTLLGWFFVLTLFIYLKISRSETRYFFIPFVVFVLYLCFFGWGIYIVIKERFSQNLVYWLIIFVYLFSLLVVGEVVLLVINGYEYFHGNLWGYI